MEPQDLPSDNAARLAIYDALVDSDRGMTDDELFIRVVGRLRVLVPRELHLLGERAYFDDKLEVCVSAGIVDTTAADVGRLLTPSPHPPRIRYPDGEIREYPRGLEPARERLDRDNARLREARFDVRAYVPSIADVPEGLDFQALLASMREHGFLKHFPIVRQQDDTVCDGRARLRAAAMLGVEVEYFKYASEKDRTAARRRDTPLNRVMISLQSNAGRLSTTVIADVYAEVARRTGRSWQETASDLEITSDWRRSVPAEYSPVFEVKKLPYRAGDEPKIQITADAKVMLRSLIEAAGLSNYKIDMLRDFVPFERARSAHSAGRKAVFARAEDLITGIAAMQQERRSSRLKLDAEWAQIHAWLVETFQSTAR